jgi:hypothetical protein
LTGAKNLLLNIREQSRRERNQQIEKKDNRVKIQTAAKNVLQTERSEKEMRAEPADDFDRSQEPSFEHKGENETRSEAADIEDNIVKIQKAVKNVLLTERSEKEMIAEPEDT